MLDAIQGLADDINNAITDKLPIVIAFNTTLHDMIHDLTDSAAFTLLTFQREIDAFSVQLVSLRSALGTLSADITDAGMRELSGNTLCFVRMTWTKSVRAKVWHAIKLFDFGYCDNSTCM